MGVAVACHDVANVAGPPAESGLQNKGGSMSDCLVCDRPAVFGANGYCLKCWDASEHFAANTYDGHGTYGEYIRRLAARYAA
jgi:hypothetical protein